MAKATTVRYLVDGLGSEERVASFGTSAEAWAFFRQCDAQGILAGFPSL